MQSISVHESTWSTTFPRLVKPSLDEWFPGLLSRCDEINGWSSGTTLAHLLRSISSSPLRGKPTWIVVPRSVLALLAQFLALPLSTLVATTYNAELARLYNTTSPHFSYLDRSFRFHLCPACIEEKRQLKRIFALPHITCCPFHKIQLMKSCQCGTILHIFHKHALPFTCHRCSSDWTNLPRLSADPESIALEYKLLLHYEFFCTKGTPTLLAKALQLVRDSVKKKRTPWVRCPDGSTKYVECYDGKRVSLGSLVESLVSLELSPQDIMTYEGVIPWWSLKWSSPETSRSRNPSQS
jgi:TniQ